MCVVVIDIKQLPALGPVAGVPDGNMVYLGVLHGRRSW